jgi:glycosyltransferase involved in cell wall biosynthesis
MNQAERSPDPRQALLFAGVFEPGVKGGGPIRSITRIVDTVSDPVVVHVVTRDRDVGDLASYPGLRNTTQDRGRHTVAYVDVTSPSGWRLVASLRRKGPWDVLYVNSVFDVSMSLVPLLLVRMGVLRAKRVVVAPRGELSPGALELKAYKKRPFLWLWRTLLKRDTWIMHASTAREAQEIEAAIGPSRTVEVEDQVDLPLRAVEPLPHDGPLRLVFISRISPKKNLLSAIQGLALVTDEVTLDIYGPIEDDAYWAECLSAARSVPSNVTVEHRGAVRPEQVVGVLAQYDGFLFPTHGENFGHVIAESLAASCPVLVTDTTPWTPFIQDGGGILLQGTDPASVAEGVRAMSGSSPEARQTSRASAGRAFESWRRSHADTNVLDITLTAPGADQE